MDDIDDVDAALAAMEAEVMGYGAKARWSLRRRPRLTLRLWHRPTHQQCLPPM